jgi:cell division GTPase FtsZ
MTLPFGMSLDATGQTVDSIINSLTHAFTASTLCDTELGEFQTMLRRGGLAGGSLGYSHSQLGAEEAVLKVLRHSTAHGYLAKANGVFIEIASGAQIKRQHVESSMNLISSQIAPHAQLVCGQRTDPALRGMTQVTLLGTGLPFPVSWRGYRKLPLELHDLEAESGEEEQLALDLKLYQLESYAT